MLGIVFFPEHAIWPALTVLLIIKPAVGDSIDAGVRRTFGTLAGVLAAEAIILVAGGSDIVVFLGFMVMAFAMTALKNVNYWVFVLFLTAALVLSQALIGEDADAAAAQRLVATILGAAIAFAAIGVGHFILARQTAGAAR